MINNKDITIYDIAEKLNLSTSTVSRALQNHNCISKSTTEKVIDAAKEMGYFPNTLAAGLRNNKLKTIGVLISKINRPFMASLISGIEENAQKAGYNVIIAQSHDSYKDEVNMAQLFYNSRVSGIICSLSMETKNTDHFRQFVDRDIPLVFVDRAPKDFNTYRVMIDNYTAGFKATEHLIEQGCKRIAHVSGLKLRTIYSERERGYRDALKKYKLTVEDKLVAHIKTMSFEQGEKAVKRFLDLDLPPDAIFASSDTIAVAAIQVAKSRGMKIPEDIAIIGFNNDPISRMLDPALSTISHPAFEMGKTSSKKILQHLKKPKKRDITEITFLNTEVIARGSSKRKIN